MSIRLFSSFISKNKNYCVNCLNYVNYKYTYPQDELYEYKKIEGSCGLYGNQNLVTGEIKYDNALICRQDKSKCGEKGIFFIERPKT